MAKKAAAMTLKGSALTQKGSSVAKKAASMTLKESALTLRGSALHQKGARVRLRGPTLPVRGACMAKKAPEAESRSGNVAASRGIGGRNSGIGAGWRGKVGALRSSAAPNWGKGGGWRGKGLAEGLSGRLSRLPSLPQVRHAGLVVAPSGAPTDEACRVGVAADAAPTGGGKACRRVSGAGFAPSPSRGGPGWGWVPASPATKAQGRHPRAGEDPTRRGDQAWVLA